MYWHTFKCSAARTESVRTSSLDSNSQTLIRLTGQTINSLSWIDNGNLSARIKNRCQFFFCCWFWLQQQTKNYFFELCHSKYFFCFFFQFAVMVWRKNGHKNCVYFCSQELSKWNRIHKQSMPFAYCKNKTKKCDIVANDLIGPKKKTQNCQYFCCALQCKWYPFNTKKNKTMKKRSRSDGQMQYSRISKCLVARNALLDRQTW